MAKNDAKNSTTATGGESGRAQQPRPGRSHQLRRNKARRTSAPIAAGEASAQKAQKGGEQPRQANMRQTKAAKQFRTMIPASVQRMRPIGKVQLARAVQPRQLSSVKSLSVAIIEGRAISPIGKVSTARVAQARQRATTKFTGLVKSK